MKTIGIIGGIASGKSTVARELANLGAGLIEVDKITHEVLEFPEIKDLVRARFTPHGFTLHEDPKEHRNEIARIVLNAPEEFAWIEQVTKPLVEEIIETRKSRYQGIPALVLDCPLLIEAGWNKYCDVIVFVKADDDVRLRRYLKRSGVDLNDDSQVEKMTRKWEGLEGRQLPSEAKQALADWIIDTNYDLSENAIQNFLQNVVQQER